MIARSVLALIVAVAVAHANGRAPASNAVRFTPGDPRAIYVGTTFGLLVSTDGLTSSVDEATWRRVMRFELIAVWRTFSQQLGITPSDTCAAASDTSVDMPARDSQPSRGGCCDAGGRPPVVASLMISIWALGRRRRR